MLKVALIVIFIGVALGIPANLLSPGGRIVGGEPTTIEQNPWQLSLMYHRQHYCGGVLINSRWALTTARCVDNTTVDYLSVRAGSRENALGGQVVNVTRIYLHYGYNPATFDNDFALLQFDEPITTINAASVTLPDEGSAIPSGEIAILTGWGLLNYTGDASSILKRVRVPVISNSLCQVLYGALTITENMFCTGDVINGGLDACTGDEGGPVIVNGRLYGIISWGIRCADPLYPGVNARVSEVVEWIHAIARI